jgi:hypothetical protein
MFTVYCINTTVFVLAPNGKISGEILKSRAQAIDMYMYLAGEFDNRNALSTDSSILN